jgi:zinc finger protein
VSFECEHCGERNNEVQFGGKIADQGTIQTLRIESASVYKSYKLGF